MKPQIEKVKNHICVLDNFIVCSYLPAQDLIKNISFYCEEIARSRTGMEVGMWKLKSLKN